VGFTIQGLTKIVFEFSDYFYEGKKQGLTVAKGDIFRLLIFGAEAVCLLYIYLYNRLIFSADDDEHHGNMQVMGGLKD
jgi:hypothetical protein